MLKVKARWSQELKRGATNPATGFEKYADGARYRRHDARSLVETGQKDYWTFPSCILEAFSRLCVFRLAETLSLPQYIEFSPTFNHIGERTLIFVSGLKAPLRLFVLGILVSRES